MLVSAQLRQEMLAHVLSCLPEEACGLLGGLDGQAGCVQAVENELHSPVRFRMRAQDQLGAFLALEEAGLELVGIFHSHPTGPAVPSSTDLAEFYYPGVLVLIWSPLGGAWQLRAFRIEAGQAVEVQLL